jgi:hypothetical protein
MGRNTESSRRERADRREHMLDMQGPHPGQGSRVRHRRLRTKRSGQWRRKPETFRISIETAGPDCAAKGFPDQLGMRMAVALSSRGRRPDTAPAMRLTAQAQGEQRAPYPGRGQNRRQGRRCPPRLRAASAKTAPSNRSVKRISHLGAGVAAMCHGHSRRPFSSRALTKAATIPIARSCPSVMRGLSPTRSASNGYARRFSPSAPPKELKAKKSFLRKGGRIPRETKSPPYAVLR